MSLGQVGADEVVHYHKLGTALFLVGIDFSNPAICAVCTAVCPTCRCAGLRNPVLNIALMVGVTDIPDWCYVEAYGTQVS